MHPNDDRQFDFPASASGGERMTHTPTPAPERIEAAAIMVRNPAKGDHAFSERRPARHNDLIRIVRGLGYKRPIEPDDQGFITSTGRFVTREEACVIARNAGQIIKKHGPDDELFSEDLW
jgi:hypothetical protein